jgi:hypothetical protein
MSGKKKFGSSVARMTTRSMSALDWRQPQQQQPDLTGSSKFSSSSKQLSRIEAGRTSPTPQSTDKETAAKTVVAASIFFFLSVALMLLTLYSLPPIRTVEEHLGKRFEYRPKTREEFVRDKDILVEYRTQYTWRLLLGMTTIYVLLQTFMVPGSGTTMNVLAGCVLKDVTEYGEYTIALPYALLSATVGALMCYNSPSSSYVEQYSSVFPSESLGCGTP